MLNEILSFNQYIGAALVELRRKIDVNLDWEHVEFKWIKKDEISKFDTVPNLIESLKRALKEEI